MTVEITLLDVKVLLPLPGSSGWRTKNKKPVQNGVTLRSMLPIVKEYGVAFLRVRACESVVSTIDIELVTMRHKRSTTNSRLR